MSDVMRAVRCHRYAGLDDRGKPIPAPAPLRDVLTLDEIPRPVNEPGHVLVRAHYAGVQYPDALQAQGLYQHKPGLPYVPGMDVSGTVIEADADRVQPGDRVVAQMSIGGLAEVVKVPASSVWRVPAGVDLAACANLGRNFFPAYYSLKVLGETTADSLVLVDGASGGVGMAAVELAKAMGARVIAGVSTPEKREPPAEAGADRVLCYGADRDGYRRFKDEVRRASAELGHPAGVDVVLDMVQGDCSRRRCCRSSGPWAGSAWWASRPGSGRSARAWSSSSRPCSWAACGGRGRPGIRTGTSRTWPRSSTSSRAARSGRASTASFRWNGSSRRSSSSSTTGAAATPSSACRSRHLTRVYGAGSEDGAPPAPVASV